ncbi:MAG: ABC transporter ATP-binding protein [Cyanobacteria bacterium J06641_5]
MKGTIEVDRLEKTYGTTTAIRDVTFRVNAGEILGFLGPNGAGKTTTMRILTGFIPATSGTARVAGFDVHDRPLAVKKRIGYLPENPPVYPDMSVRGYLDFVARIKGVAAGDRRAKVEAAMERCGLSDRAKSTISKLSKGYRQRVGIAQAIVHDPPVIILDEPTVGLDPRQIIEVRNLIKSLAGERTIVLSTHILPEVSMTCDRVAIIADGRVVATDTPENLMVQLAASNGYSLEVEGDPATIEPLLQAVPGVTGLVWARGGDERDANGSLETRHRLQASVAPDCEPGREIAAALVGAGVGLYELRRSRPTLEDVFLKLTTQEVPLQEERPAAEENASVDREENASAEETEAEVTT